MNPLAEGTKCAAWSRVTVPAGGVVSLRFRLCPAANPDERDPAAFDAVMARRLAEADAFYGALQRDIADPDARLVQRQALAGMLWSKQFYHFDVRRWLTAIRPSRPRRKAAATAATATGPISTTPTSSRCRTSGNIPGTRPGTSPSTA